MIPELHAFLRWGADKQNFHYSQIAYWIEEYERYLITQPKPTSRRA